MMPFCRSSGGGVHITTRVLESVAIAVMFSGRPLGTVCREMQKLCRQKAYLQVLIRVQMWIFSDTCTFMCV